MYSLEKAEFKTLNYSINFYPLDDTIIMFAVRSNDQDDTGVTSYEGSIIKKGMLWEVLMWQGSANHPRWEVPVHVLPQSSIIDAMDVVVCLFADDGGF